MAGDEPFMLAQKADGALRDALSIFDQMVSFSGNNITYKDVITNLNVLDYEYYFKMVDNILAKDNNSILLLLNEVIDNGFDTQHFIQGLATHLRNLLLGKDERIIDLMDVSRQLKSRYAEQAKKCSQHFLLKSLDLANQCDINFKSCNNKRLHLEICLLKMCYAETVRGQQTTDNRQQATVNSQQTTDNRQQTTGNRQQATENRQQTTVNVQQATEIKQVRTRLNRPSTISITSEEKAKKEDLAEEIWNDNFSQDQLTNAWNNFIVSHQDISPGFVAGIKNAEPRILDKSTIQFKIDNILVVKDQNNMQILHNYLKNALHNNQFILKELIVERPKETFLYTDKEKFEKMAEKNPDILNIKNTLGLQLDI